MGVDPHLRYGTLEADGRMGRLGQISRHSNRYSSPGDTHSAQSIRGDVAVRGSSRTEALELGLRLGQRRRQPSGVAQDGYNQLANNGHQVALRAFWEAAQAWILAPSSSG